MQRTSGSAPHSSTCPISPSISSAESALRASGRFSVARPIACPVSGRVRRAASTAGNQIIAFTPVAARPMISFWIWEVPS